MFTQGIERFALLYLGGLVDLDFQFEPPKPVHAVPFSPLTYVSLICATFLQTGASPVPIGAASHPFWEFEAEVRSTRSTFECWVKSSLWGSEDSFVVYTVVDDSSATEGSLW